MLPSALPWQACSGKCLLNGYSEHEQCYGTMAS